MDGRRLSGVLAGRPAAQLEQLIREIAIPPFAPGPLSAPTGPPDQRNYQVSPLTGMRALSSAARRDHQEASRRAQERFEDDWHAAAQAEERRQRQLAEYYRQYQAWAEAEHLKIRDNDQVRLIGRQMAAGDREAVREHFTASAWPLLDRFDASCQPGPKTRVGRGY